METGSIGWRVLESETGSDRSRASEAGEGGRDADAPRLHLSTLVGIALAGVVAGLGVALVVLGPTPVATLSTSSDAQPVAAAVPAGSGNGAASDATGVASALVVDVAGAVARPGVYRLPAGARVGDAIAAAGGFGPRVDVARADLELNLAAPVTDGARVRVPSRDDASLGGDGGKASTAVSGEASSSSGSASGPLDLNAATAAELDTLPGVGPATAAKIIAGREERRYASVDELLARKIVGSATFAKLRDLVTVR